ncbi:MAG: M28 family peptidase [Bacteroidales bacterium]|nr:M28 family peptidase [Bacteroidales bacterium]
MKKPFVCIFLAVILAPLFAQNTVMIEQMVYQKKQEQILSYLADDMTQGRASGTNGKQLAEQFIISQFKKYGLKPYNWNYTQSFKYDSIAIRNVIGFIPAVGKSDEFVILSAHYDHIGILHGNIYNGADDNASGVTAMLNIAEMFATMKIIGKGPLKNIIFVAFDGKELSMSGSEYFVKNLTIPKTNIACAINLDMLGTDLVPPGNNPEYLIVLGNERLKKSYRGLIEKCKSKSNINLDIDYTFYGSKDFTKLFYTMSDQYSFAKSGIPAILFTSAFHDYTYKPGDDIDIINFPILIKRTLLIFNFINEICKEQNY